MRTVRLAQTSSTTESATSTITSALRVRAPCPPAPVLRLALSTWLVSVFDACSAGTSPAMMPVITETASENPSTGRLIVTRDSLGT